MINNLKKSGQKYLRKFSRVSRKASEEGKEHIKENLIQRVPHIRDIKLLILEWSLLVTALVLLAITQAFWSSSSYANDTFVDGGTYIEATIGQINSFNPLFATTNSEKVVSKLLFATLMAVDYSGNPGLQLAESLRASENGKIWTMRLRDNLKWSDGEPLTNEDVLFTIGLIQNPVVNSIYNKNLEGVKVVENEEGNIVFTLNSAYADFATALEIPVLPKHLLENVEPKTLIENEFSTAPIGSGPFVLNAVQTSGAGYTSVVYLSANTSYYLGKPMLNSFAVNIYDNKNEIVNAINAGKITATAELSGPEADKINSRAFLSKNSSTDAGVFVFFNTSSEQLKNQNLRAAIRRGINIEKIREAAPDTIALDYPFIDSQIELSAYPEIPAHDLEAAKAKIAELKGDDSINLRIATVNSGYLPAVTEALKNELSELGVEANVTVYGETQEFVTGVIAQRNYDILVYEVELGADPDPLPYYHSSQISTVGLNLSNYRQSIVDDLLVGARETLDTTLRAKKYETFLKYWVADVPAIGLYRANLTYIYNKNARAYGNDVRLVTAIDRFSDILNFATVKDSRNKTP
jgi:peptide/nickel transport system substrate-binding protein